MGLEWFNLQHFSSIFESDFLLHFENVVLFYFFWLKFIFGIDCCQIKFHFNDFFMKKISIEIRIFIL